MFDIGRFLIIATGGLTSLTWAIPGTVFDKVFFTIVFSVPLISYGLGMSICILTNLLCRKEDLDANSRHV